MIGRPARSSGRLVAAFFLSFFTLVASGRLASSDAGAQLQAATRVVASGEVGVDHLPPGGASGWQRAPNGRYYEPHDIGNILLMLPAAWIGRLTSHATADEDFAAPPVASRLAVSLTYAVVNALTCVFLFGLLALFDEARDAFALSVAFAVTTIFLPYAKTAWDVLGACCGVSAFAYASARIVSGRRSVADAAALGLAFAMACAFRYSLAPFLGVSLAVLWYELRGEIEWRHVAIVAAVATAGLAPSFVFNQLRTGEFWRPATATPAYLATNNALDGNIFHGALGLLAAPNRGLLVSSPIFVLVCAVPFVWKRLAHGERTLLTATGTGVLLYWLTLARLSNWGGAFAWGPRYLVPVLPVLFLGVAGAARVLRTEWRRAILALAATSAILNVVPATVNWSNAIAADPRALDQDALAPYQHAAVWRALGDGLAGRPLELAAAVAADPERSAAARFPDFWIARLMERSRLGLLAGIVIGLSLLAVALISFQRIVRKHQHGGHGGSTEVTVL